MQDAQFDFYEKVLIESTRPELAQINGKLAAVLGRAQGDDGRWSYAAHVYDNDECFSCNEDDLKPTGEFDRRETFYDGISIRVSLDGLILE